jgi:hypothetical protein
MPRRHESGNPARIAGEHVSELTKTLPMRLLNVLLVGLLYSLGAAPSLRSETPKAPDVLVLGDSQLSFGAGKAFVDLLGAMAGTCGLDADATTGVIGVRSSAIHSWTGRTRQAKSAICDVDRQWRVNAGVYGTLSQGENAYVQIGSDRKGPFGLCSPGRSPLEMVFADGYYRPRLVIFFMMGNAAERWADSPAAARRDVAALTADLPPGQPCIFMTSAPTYDRRTTDLRQKAQDNIAQAFARSDSQCSFVPGFTAATIRENLGNSANFRRTESGRVKDPYHPTEPAARRFLKLQRAALCKAIARQLAQGTSRAARVQTEPQPTGGAATRAFPG